MIAASSASEKPASEACEGKDAAKGENIRTISTKKRSILRESVLLAILCESSLYIAQSPIKKDSS